jgi:hypothetical protein
MNTYTHNNLVNLSRYILFFRLKIWKENVPVPNRLRRIRDIGEDENN